MHHCGRQCVAECLCPTQEDIMIKYLLTQALCVKHTIFTMSCYEPCFWPASTQYCASTTFLQCKHHSSDRQGEEEFAHPIMNTESVNQYYTNLSVIFDSDLIHNVCSSTRFQQIRNHCFSLNRIALNDVNIILLLINSDRSA